MNIVILSGNICKEWEVRTTVSGKTVISNTIALRDGKKNSQFIQVKAWEQTADLLLQYIEKGDKVTLQGRIKTDSYDKNGSKNYYTYVLVDTFEFGYKPKGKGNNDMTNASEEEQEQAAAFFGDNL